MLDLVLRKPCWLSTLNYRVCSICLSFLCIVYNTKLQQSFCIFLCTKYITHWSRISYLEDIFYLNVAFSTSMLHFTFWRALHLLSWWHFLPWCCIFHLYNIFYSLVLFYLDGIFYLDVAFIIENRMNASAFRDIWARVMFLKFPKYHGRSWVQFENFKSITTDHISRNARAIISLFVCNILKKNYKRIHLWYILLRKTFVTFYRDLRARTPPV